MRRYFLLLPVILAVVACAPPQEEAEYIERPLNEIYRSAQSQFAGGDFSAAAEEFEEVERQHPHSQWAVRAQIMSAYAYFISGRYEEAILTMDRFIELNPGSEYTPYAYYLRAMSSYVQITDVERDQKASYDALQGFEQVLVRYGDSAYARDSQLKRDLVIDHLAGKEVEVGLYYLRLDEFSAAINRFRTVIDNFQTTTHVPEALARMVEAYTALGLFDEAVRLAAVLQHNYPENYWYEYAHKLLADVGAVAPQTNPTRDWSGYNTARQEKLHHRWFGGRSINIKDISPPPENPLEEPPETSETSETEKAASATISLNRSAD